jgi:hypothetical protein
MQILKRVAAEISMIKIAGQSFPADMLPGDLRRRWDGAQVRATHASTRAERAKVCDEILNLTTEIAGSVASHAVLRAAPRRSLFDLGKS